MPAQWKRQQHGGGMSAILGTGLVLSVTLNLTRLPEGEPKFNINVLGRRLEGRAHTMEEGQQKGRGSRQDSPAAGADEGCARRSATN